MGRGLTDYERSGKLADYYAFSLQTMRGFGNGKPPEGSPGRARESAAPEPDPFAPRPRFVRSSGHIDAAIARLERQRRQRLAREQLEREARRAAAQEEARRNAPRVACANMLAESVWRERLWLRRERRRGVFGKHRKEAIKRQRRILVQNANLRFSDGVIRTVAAANAMDPRDVVSKRRDRRTAAVRRLAVTIVRALTDFSYPDIGALFGRDHTTAMYCVEREARDRGFVLPDGSIDWQGLSAWAKAELARLEAAVQAQQPAQMAAAA